MSEEGIEIMEANPGSLWQGGYNVGKTLIENASLMGASQDDQRRVLEGVIDCLLDYRDRLDRQPKEEDVVVVTGEAHLTAVKTQ